MALPFSTRKLAVPAAFEKVQSFIESEFTESTLQFYMNGTKVELPNPNPDWTLLDFVRSQHGTKGTKLGCGEGGCGACTVVIQTIDTKQKGRLKHMAVNACLFPLIGGKHLSSVKAYHTLTFDHQLWGNT
jgi:xanthine dehydrogenase/oxidase